MERYEYKVVPAPRRFARVKARGSEGKAAATLEADLNALAADGWDYVRADTLPFDERSGLTQRTTVFHTLLVYRRRLEARNASDPPRALPAPDRAAAPRDADPSAPAGDPEDTADRTDGDPPGPARS